MVDSLLCRTSAQPANSRSALISASDAPGSRRPEYSKSTTVSLGSFRVRTRIRRHLRQTDHLRLTTAVVQEDQVARLHRADGPQRLRVLDPIPDRAFIALQIVDGIGAGFGFCQEVFLHRAPASAGSNLRYEPYYPVPAPGSRTSVTDSRIPGWHVQPHQLVGAGIYPLQVG